MNTVNKTLLTTSALALIAALAVQDVPPPKPENAEKPEDTEGLSRQQRRLLERQREKQRNRKDW